MADTEFRLDLGGLDFEIFQGGDAAGFLLTHGPQVRDLVRTAFATTLELSLLDAAAAGEIAAAIVHGEQSDEYYAQGLADPHVAIQRGELSPASFDEQRVVAVYRAADLVGLNISHDTASNPLAGAKMATPPWLPAYKVGGRRYAWQQLEAVRADERGHGIAEAAGDVSLAERHPRQNATAYTSPKLLPGAARRLERYGFAGGSPYEGQIGGYATQMVRYQARVRTARTAMRDQIPGFNDAMVTARRRTYRFPY